MTSITGFFLRVFSLDTRSLSYFRIGIGLILLFDLCRRLWFFDALFFDQGIMPLELLYNTHYEASFRSLYTIIKAQRRSIFLFGIHLIAVCSYIVGWKTKEVSILIWILTCSLYGRNPEILNGGDTLIRVGLFRSMFLPLGSHLSVDAWQRHGDWHGKEPKTIRNIATVGFIAQLLCVYIFTFLMKTDPIWTQEFTATYYALSLDAFRTLFGDRLYSQPALMKILTAMTYFIEGYGALLLFIPWQTKWWRKAAIVLFIAFHLGLAAAMHLGPFPAVAIVYWIALRHHTPTQEVKYRHMHPLIQSGLAGALLLIICWNIRTTDFDYHEQRFPKSINRLVFTLRIEQSWSMFSPYPFRDDGWFIFTGTDIYGNERNINTELPGIRYNEEGQPRRLYSSELRHKYYSNIWKKKKSYLRIPFLEYACDHVGDLSRIRIDFKREYTLPDYDHKPYELVHLASHTCR